MSSKNILSTSHSPGSVLDTEVTTVNKKDNDHGLTELTLQWGQQTEIIGR